MVLCDTSLDPIILSAIIDSATHLIWVADSDCKLLMFNGAFMEFAAKYCGVDNIECGQDFTCILAIDACDANSMVKRGFGGDTFIQRLDVCGNRIIDVHVNKVVIGDRIVALGYIAHDVTDDVMQIERLYDSVYALTVGVDVAIEMLDDE